MRLFHPGTLPFLVLETRIMKPGTFPQPDFPTESHIPYEGVALIADPIHGYITFTVPYSSVQIPEQTEKDLIDSPWVQRLRSIYQLQSAHWVYPSAEHTRFQHSLGAMHLAGRFAKSLYPTLRPAFGNFISLTDQSKIFTGIK